ncbi:2-hydroxyacyl-CoA dehydratase [Clostridium sp.]|uniref:2-hydroxyacyl-CoA dehydratase n=1 Tax=Clostridium sp. TaxID=1506 RepID=UPI002613FA77|nr:2-hydroxyacyl-CoA dehydratase [Clostridium sp.]
MTKSENNGFAVFTKEMKKTHTILAPTMLPIHFKLLSGIMKKYGYKLEFFNGDTNSAIEEGLKSVHNDICYPAMIVIGQLMEAIKSGKYDKNKIALIMSQTGGGCRASNYIHLLRKALKENGLENIPVISLNASGLEKHEGFKMYPGLLIKCVYALFYGDMLMWLYNQCKSYEKNKGETDILLDNQIEYLKEKFEGVSYIRVRKIYKEIVESFFKLELKKEKKVKVGIVGEIYLKYSPLGNNELEKFLRGDNAEVVMSGVTDFFMYCLSNSEIDRKLYGMKKMSSKITKIANSYLEHLQKLMIKSINSYSNFNAPTPFKELKNSVEEYIGRGVKMGEGWLMTAEMLELINSGVNNIVCAQPFGCLPNHIVGKGMIRGIMEKHPEANIVVVDYDPSSTKVNQENRIKLMLANAKLSEYLSN